jgi:sec-independent protein translocase protein TatC
MSTTNKPTVETTYPLVYHLKELRTRFIYVFVAFLVVFGLCYWQSHYIYEFLVAPLKPYLKDGVTLTMMRLTEGFLTEIKFSAMAAIVVLMPFILFQFWRFVAPGLYKEERRYLVGFIFAGTFLFVCGAAFVYKFVFPLGFKLFTSYVDKWDDMQATFSISFYLGFITKLMVAFGAVFEMPVVVFFLTKIGLVNTDMMRRNRKYAILGIFIVAAILTPPDVISQVAMAIPLMILYEISIWITKIWGPKPKLVDQTADIYE